MVFFFSTFDWDHLAKIPEYCWKKLPEISKFAKCPGLLKTNEIVSPQSRRILLTFVWLGGGGGGGGGDNFVSPAHHTNVCKVSRLCGATSSLARFARITFKLGKFTVIKAPSPAVSMVRSMDIRFAY